MGPNLTMSSLVRHDVGGVDVGKVIHEGRMDKGMPAFPQITDAQAADIAAFVHARIDAFTRASALGVSAFAGSLNVGDATAGKAVFAAKCATCHSVTGDMKGIATKRDGAGVGTGDFCCRGEAGSGSVTAAGKTYKGLFLHRDGFTVTLRTDDGVAHTWETDHVTGRRTIR